MKRVMLLALLMMLSSMSPLFAGDFEGVLTIQTVMHESSDMYGMTPEMSADEMASVQQEIEQLKKELANAEGENREWLQQEIESQEDYLAAMSGEGETEVSHLYIKGSMMKVEMENSDDPAVIFKDDKIIMVDHKQKSYQEMTMDEMKTMFSQMKDAMMGAMPPEMQQQMKQHMEQQSKNKTAAKPSIDKTGKTEKIAGYACEYVKATQGDKVLEAWISHDFDNLYARFLDMEETFGQMAQEFGEMDEDLEMVMMRDVKGIPLKTIQKEGGEITETSEVTQIEAKSLSADVFTPPASYKKNEGNFMQQEMMKQ